jgi:sec-independent protein translocase protein TatC
MPLVITFLARVGLVTHTTLLSKWRHAIVIILVAAAIITPTPDPFNMSLLAGPILGLYLLSIALAAIFGRPREQEDYEAEPPRPEPEPAPEPTPSNPPDETEPESEDDSAGAPADDYAEEPEDRML